MSIEARLRKVEGRTVEECLPDPADHLDALIDLYRTALAEPIPDGECDPDERAFLESELVILEAIRDDGRPAPYVCYHCSCTLSTIEAMGRAQETGDDQAAAWYRKHMISTGVGQAAEIDRRNWCYAETRAASQSHTEHQPTPTITT